MFSLIQLTWPAIVSIDGTSLRHACWLAPVGSTAVICFFWLCWWDRKDKLRVLIITAKLIANLLYGRGDPSADRQPRRALLISWSTTFIPLPVLLVPAQKSWKGKTWWSFRWILGSEKTASAYAGVWR